MQVRSDLTLSTKINDDAAMTKWIMKSNLLYKNGESKEVEQDNMYVDYVVIIIAIIIIVM